MNLRQRIDLLARAHPRLFPRVDLRRLVVAQLGHLDALDSWITRDEARQQARAPRTIYHICAGNLAVSACTSIAHGLILGAHNIVKLPDDRDDGSTRRDILAFIRALPAPLRRLVETYRMRGDDLLQRADVVVAFGSDPTMRRLSGSISPRQKLVAHGHAVSLLYLPDSDRLTARQTRACAVDVLTYDQLGCLSPQAIYVPPGTDVAKLGAKLAEALERHWRQIKPQPPRSLPVAARIAEARDVAFARGHRAWLPLRRHLGWTLIHDPDPAFRPSPLHGVITIRTAGERQLRSALRDVNGRISTVGVAGQLSSRLQELFLSLGVSRFCPAGRMQFPPLTWHHDGRATLAELVTWVDTELPA
jgi:hypothetical protein